MKNNTYYVVDASYSDYDGYWFYKGDFVEAPSAKEAIKKSRVFSVMCYGNLLTREEAIEKGKFTVTVEEPELCKYRLWTLNKNSFRVDVYISAEIYNEEKRKKLEEEIDFIFCEEA